MSEPLRQSETSPRYEHDGCPRCQWLGQQDDEDVYYCNQAGTFPTVIFRFGDDGADYRSGWHLRGTLAPELERRLQEMRFD